jgi:phospholipase/carboxylesterase
MITRLPKGAKSGLVLLHGRGGSAADILLLLDHAGLDSVAAIAPEAVGHSWWPTSFLAPSASLQPYLAQGLAAVGQAVQALEQAGIARSAIWLGGFSQGACLALESFAREGEGLAGVFGFSGGLLGLADKGVPSPALYGHGDKDLTYPGKRSGKVWISVHERDPHIPLQRVQDSIAALRAMGADVRAQVYPGAGHALGAPDLAALGQLLNEGK